MTALRLCESMLRPKAKKQELDVTGALLVSTSVLSQKGASQNLVAEGGFSKSGGFEILPSALSGPQGFKFLGAAPAGVELLPVHVPGTPSTVAKKTGHYTPK